MCAEHGIPNGRGRSLKPQVCQYESEKKENGQRPERPRGQGGRASAVRDTAVNRGGAAYGCGETRRASKAKRAGMRMRVVDESDERVL